LSEVAPLVIEGPVPVADEGVPRVRVGGDALLQERQKSIPRLRELRRLNRKVNSSR
jgi:hypothetical protein